tara:strand:- start:808 stop:1560 length:753 start_codon:yes stop_codon:yes gene_type:complete
MAEDGKENENTQDEETQTTTAEEQVKTLRAELQEVTSEKERLEGGYKGLQRTISEKDRAMQSQSNSNSRISAMESNIQVITDMVADVVDRADIDEGELPKKRRSDEYRERHQQTESETDTPNIREQEWTRVAVEADGLAKSVGLDIASSPELSNASYMFRAWDERAGLEEVKRVVAEKKSKGTEANTDNQQSFDDKVQEEVRKKMQEKGLVETEVPSPSAASASKLEATERYIRGEITAEQAKERGVDFD